MKYTLLTITVALVVSGVAIAGAQNAPASPAAVTPAADPAPASDGLSELDALTFGCSRAALNAAARKASQVPSQGTYQFSYFNIVSNTHHAVYEVHFTSNYADESELKYCVEIYCQQGWDPKTAKTAITVMSNAPQRTRAGAHADSCSEMHLPATRTKTGS
jgi:hypothetical protein